jgi:hypothetical protein
MQMGASSIWGKDFLDSLMGVLFSPSRGLFIYQPWILLLLVPIFYKIEVPKMKSWIYPAVISIVLQVLIISAWLSWWGGTCWGSRLLSETIPFFALLVVIPVEFLLSRKKGRLVLVLFLGLSGAMHFNGVFGKGSTWAQDYPDKSKTEIEMLWDWKHPPFLYGLF